MKFLSDILIKAGIVVEGSSTLQSLAGTGTRMVVANAAGLISAQAIPTGNVTGSSAAGRVAIWDSASNIIGSNSLLYDTATGNLSIGGSGSSYRLNVLGVADSAIGQVITATSGRINMYPYHSVTYGGLMESRNLLDTASQPITLSGSNVILLGSSATVTSLAGSGVRMVVADASGVLSSQAIPVSSVTSVFGRTGAVTSQSGDYTTTQVTEGTNLYFTNARSRSAITLTTTGTSGASTYDSINGILNIPSYVGGVTSVNGQTGAVTLTTTNITEGANLYYTDARARAAISLTTTGSSGAATYTAGVLNIPNYTLSGLGGVSGSGASGQVSYWDGTTSQTGSVNFTWDNAGRTLTLSGADTTQILNQTNTTLASAVIFRENGVTKGYIQYVGSAFSGTDRRQVLEIRGNNGLSFWTSAEQARLHTNGNFALGSPTTDTTERLQVTGTAKITGATSIGAALTVTGQVTAGNAQAPNGSTIIRSTYSSGNLSNIGTNGSSGAISINYAAYNASTSTADAYLSGTGIAAYGRASYVVESDHRWLSSTPALVAEGSAVTLTEKMRLYNNGNLVLQTGGTYSNSTQKLQVYGDTLLGGNVDVASGSFIRQSGNTAGGIRFVTGDVVFYNTSNNAFATFTTGTSGTSSTFESVIFNAGLTGTRTFNNISGTSQFVAINNTFSPASGTGVLNAVTIATTVNQAGGANGAVRALYINPNLTTGSGAADWRSIEWSNNSGYGLYGAGTAQNLLNGKLTVNHTVLAANFTNTNTMGVFGQQLLNIPTGTQGTAGAVYAANSGFHYFRFNGTTTLVGDALWAGSIAVSNIQFDTAGTITMADGVGAGTRHRALSGMQIQMQIAGNNNGTISRAAGLLIQGCYPSTGTGVTTFTEFAGIRINNLTEWGTDRVTMTDRWGIFQAGADDKNHFNGAVIIGTTAATGSKLKISGLPTSAAGLTAGDVWSNGGVLTIV
jgi:fibronectin-binding autotransporter adhesin